MKHYIIFSIIFLIASHPRLYSMDTKQHRKFKPEQAYKQRSLRDELFFAHTINARGIIPDDIIRLILHLSYQLKMEHSELYKLNFNLLSNTAFIDFLYFTNEEETRFLKMWPYINPTSHCLELIMEDEDFLIYMEILPSEIHKYATRLTKSRNEG